MHAAMMHPRSRVCARDKLSQSLLEIPRDVDDHVDVAGAVVDRQVLRVRRQTDDMPFARAGSVASKLIIETMGCVSPEGHTVR